MSDDYRVGYGRPPQEHRFKRGGKSPNPRGRPRKEREQPQSLSALIRAIGNEMHQVGGRRYSKNELMIVSLYNKALKGDARAVEAVVRLQDKSGLLDKNGGGGVLVVEEPLSVEEWARRAGAQQAQYRENTGEKS